MEQVLVVERKKIEQYISGRNGLITDHPNELFEIIKAEHEFMPRPEAEQRPDYKQIIPYVAAMKFSSRAGSTRAERRACTAKFLSASADI
mgnify:CR=1 FL=1